MLSSITDARAAVEYVCQAGAVLRPFSVSDEIQTNREEPLLLGPIAFFYIYYDRK